MVSEANNEVPNMANDEAHNNNIYQKLEVERKDQ
jgi:hypothetical protein